MPPQGKPEEKPSGRPDLFVEVISLIFGLLFLLYIVNGAILAAKNIWSEVSGPRGFTKEGIILSHARPISDLENPLNTRIINQEETSVYDSPAGRNIGNQPVLARGKILQGPVSISDSRYWYVDYDTDPDGWVKESSIAYLTREPNLFERILIYIITSIWYIAAIVVILTILSIMEIIYLWNKLDNLRTNERKLLYPETAKTFPENKNPHWQKIIEHIDSQNENDWRLAILEADIMLDGLLTNLSLPGDTIGEKLKAVDRSDFRTIDNAWEAHRVRNDIAHEGSRFHLNHREAKRVIELYKSVFNEFHLI